MKKILLFGALALLFSCSSNDDASIETETVNLFVNHFKTTSLLSGTAFLIQEDESIGSDSFATTPFIQDFDFQPGFTYRITAEKTKTENAGTDAVTTSFRALEVVEKNRVGELETFTIPVATFVNGVGYVSYLNGDLETGFMLSNEILIDCHDLCSPLHTVVLNREIATASFTHGTDGAYILQELF